MCVDGVGFRQIGGTTWVCKSLPGIVSMALVLYNQAQLLVPVLYILKYFAFKAKERTLNMAH